MEDFSCKTCSFTLSPEQRAELTMHLETHPPTDTREVLEYIEKTFYVDCKEDEVIALLNILGFSYTRPAQGGFFAWLKK